MGLMRYTKHPSPREATAVHSRPSRSRAGVHIQSQIASIDQISAYRPDELAAWILTRTNKVAPITSTIDLHDVAACRRQTQKQHPVQHELRSESLDADIDVHRSPTDCRFNSIVNRHSIVLGRAHHSVSAWPASSAVAASICMIRVTTTLLGCWFSCPKLAV